MLTGAGKMGALFDLDGTVTDSMRYWRYSALEYILKRRLPVYDDIVLKMPGTSSSRTVPESLARDGIEAQPGEFMPALHEIMVEHYRKDVSAKEGIRGVLDMLKAAGARCGVATMTPGVGALSALERNGLYDAFDMVLGYRDLPWPKESGRYWLCAAERLGSDPARTVVFEDALYAMRGAKAAGMRVCAMRDDAQKADRDEIRELSDVYIEKWEEFTQEALGRLYGAE